MIQENAIPNVSSLPPSDTTSATTSTLVHDDQAGKPAKRSKRNILHKLHGHKMRWGHKRQHTGPTSQDPTKSTNIELTRMSGVPSHDSILYSAQVQAQYEQQGREADALQASVHMIRRVPWAYTHRKELRAKIKAIGSAITMLESLLMPWPVEKASYQQPPSQDARFSSSILLQAQGALTRLHEALMRLNEQQCGQQPFILSIQLREDVEMSRQELAREPSVHLRNKSFIFNIQRQRTGDVKGASSLFFAESLIHAPSYAEKVLSDVLDEERPFASGLTELHDLVANPEKVPIQNSQIVEPIETWGYFRTSPTNNDAHVLLHDSSGQWSSPFDLADILAGSEYRSMMSPTQIIQLARLILISHLYFLAVRPSLGIDPSPCHYRFFSRLEENSETWNADDPLVLRPWLAFGFGSRAPRAKLGGGSGVANAPNASLIKLGLVLYQIGAGVTIEYGSSKSGLLKAKASALRELNRVDSVAGMTLTDVVQACLSPENLSSTGTKLEREEETDFIMTAISTMTVYEQYLEGTMSKFECQATAGEVLEDLTPVAAASSQDSGQRPVHASTSAEGPSEFSKSKAEVNARFKIESNQVIDGVANVNPATGDDTGCQPPVAGVYKLPKGKSTQTSQHIEEVLEAADRRIPISG